RWYHRSRNDGEHSDAYDGVTERAEWSHPFLPGRLLPEVLVDLIRTARSGFTGVLKSMLPRASLANINRPCRRCDDTSHVGYVSGRLDYPPEKSQSRQPFAVWGDDGTVAPASSGVGNRGHRVRRHLTERAGANLPEASGAHHCRVPRWGAERHYCTADRAMAVGASWAGIRRREPAWGSQQYRDRGGLAGTSRRLHASAGHFDQRRQRNLL